MLQIDIRKFKDVTLASTNNGVSSLFGFAVEDYLDLYKLDKESAGDRAVLGVIIEKTDSYETISNIIELGAMTNMSIMVFDINRCEAKQIYHIRETFKHDHSDYTELPEIYDPTSRLVFARK